MSQCLALVFFLFLILPVVALLLHFFSQCCCHVTINWRVDWQYPKARGRRGTVYCKMNSDGPDMLRWSWIRDILNLHQIWLFFVWPLQCYCFFSIIYMRSPLDYKASWHITCEAVCVDVFLSLKDKRKDLNSSQMHWESSLHWDLFTTYY